MRCGMTMKAAFAFALLAATLAVPGQAQRRGDQDAVYKGRREGALRSLRDIENAIVPGMTRRGADYIGSEFDSGSGRYRLKFVRNGAVIWVDIDGRTGDILARAGD